MLLFMISSQKLFTLPDLVVGYVAEILCLTFIVTDYPQCSAAHWLCKQNSLMYCLQTELAVI